MAFSKVVVNGVSKGLYFIDTRIYWLSVGQLLVDFHAWHVDKWWNTKDLFFWHGILHSLVSCLFIGLLAFWSNECGMNAVTILDCMIQVVFFIIQLGVGPLELTRTHSTLVINMVVCHGPAR
jgi:hypothetical protein